MVYLSLITNGLLLDHTLGLPEINEMIIEKQDMKIENICRILICNSIKRLRKYYINFIPFPTVISSLIIFESHKTRLNDRNES